MESGYVTLDTCIGPILADVPIITHVTVEKTHVADGHISVSWRKPFQVNQTQFPSPYHYETYSAVGFARGGDSTNVTPPGFFTDTTFLDQGLNSEGNVCNYSIAAYASNGGSSVHRLSIIGTAIRKIATPKD